MIPYMEPNLVISLSILKTELDKMLSLAKEGIAQLVGMQKSVVDLK